MPMPHRTFAQVAKRRLQGTEGAERVRVINALVAELPDYRNGPYADLRKWLNGELERTRVRAKVVHRDSLAVRREGAAQIALVGAPNAGKSSLLQALSEIQIKTGDYAFTTLRPVPALTRIRGVLVQLIEIPGLIEGAAEGRGGGRALLGVLRNADAIVFCQAVSASFEELRVVRDEVAAAGIEKPAALAVTKLDDAREGDLSRLAAAFPELETIGVSVLDDASLDALRDLVWRLTGLIRVFLRHGREADDEPVALAPGATVVDVADTIHHELAAACAGAHVWGPSARFEGQRVGRDHRVADGDVVEILTR
jgi:small GTP-binding protein